MSLLDPLNQVFNVAAEPRTGDHRAVGIINLENFNRAIERTRIDPVMVPNPVDPLMPFFRPRPDHRGTLYVPPGRYILSRAEDITRNWGINFSQPPVMGENREANVIARNGNPFGASVTFPEGTTLWLAPGAVLVPARGCVIDISSLLVCETTKCFDLSLGGLVVFGQAVPVLRPEWWGAVSGEEASDAIQAAIDAAIHNRSVEWPAGLPLPNGSIPYQTRSRPPLVVEMRGSYRVIRTIDIRADVRSDGVVRQHGTGTPLVAPSGVRGGAINAKTIVRGAWEGGHRRGATLVALGDDPATGRLGLGENPILRLAACAGITVQAIAFMSQRSDYQPGLEIRASSGVEVGLRLEASQNIMVRACRFEGPARPLVQVGARTVIFPPDPPRINTPYVLPASEVGVDFCMLSFDECDFMVSGRLSTERPVGIDVRANQTLPIRYRRCEFSGSAAAMMSLWNATHYLEGCRFANIRAPAVAPLADRPSNVRGLEEPEGSDIFLRAEYPWLFEEGAVPRTFLDNPNAFPREPLMWPGHVLIRFELDFVPGLLALGCVSDSPQFLSSVIPGVSVRGQVADWPTVLVNIRHRAPRPGLGPSVRWGLTNIQAGASRGSGSNRDMTGGASLALIGGVFSNEILFLRGSLQGAVVGARVAATPPIRIESGSYPALPWPPTVVFGLPADQR